MRKKYFSFLIYDVKFIIIIVTSPFFLLVTPFIITYSSLKILVNSFRYMYFSDSEAWGSKWTQVSSLPY